MDESARASQVTRREVLKKGLIGAAGLTVLPTVIAACSTSSGTASAAPTASSAASTAASAAPTASAAPAATPITFGSNYSDAVPKAAMPASTR